ncbi:hypothetical protein TNCV_3633081 [Trichonephila clavipes]|nr:hypothetical protein TNCV_3633081 [Trichonephila clavipes]
MAHFSGSTDHVGEVVPMCFCHSKPDEDVDTTLLFSHSVAQGWIGASGRHPSWQDHRAGWPRQQPGQASGGIPPKSHSRWLGANGQQPWLSPGSSG